MDRIEKIEKYIQNTGRIDDRYCIGTEEILELRKKGLTDAIILAFNYGRAKGYRAGKKEARA